jgi:hypothetical protein
MTRKTARTAKSLFNGAKKVSLIENKNELNQLHSLNTRYFRRVLKLKGKDAFINLMSKHMQSVAK